MDSIELDTGTAFVTVSFACVLGGNGLWGEMELSAYVEVSSRVKLVEP